MSMGDFFALEGYMRACDGDTFEIDGIINRGEKYKTPTSNYNSRLADRHESAVNSRVNGLLRHISEKKNIELFVENLDYNLMCEMELKNHCSNCDHESLDTLFIKTINKSNTTDKRSFFEYYKNKIMFYKHKFKVLKKFYIACEMKK